MEKISGTRGQVPVSLTIMTMTIMTMASLLTLGGVYICREN